MKKNVIILISALFVLIFLGSVFYFFFNTKEKEKFSEVNSSVMVVKEGYRGQIEYIEGDVEKRVSSDGGWLGVERGDIVKKDMEVRTLSKSRAIITFEDGSILRLAADTQIKFFTEKNKIKVFLTKGVIFNKVAKNEGREYSVDVDEYKFLALGTAFSVERESQKDLNLMVVESEVEIKDANNKTLEKISTGNKAEVLEGSIKKEQISQEDMSEEFVAWNMEKDKISVPDKENETEKISVKKISLWGSTSGGSVKLGWKVDGGESLKGFKLVKSKEKNPVYPGNDYQYLSDSGARNYTWEVGEKGGYYFRVCVYDGEKCTIYSDNLYLEVSPMDSSSDSADTLTLSAEKSGKHSVKFKWSLKKGEKASKGFKLVKSKEKNPVYPGNDYQYLSDSDTRSYEWDGLEDGKKYYFRVCIYEGGKCGDYSNNVSVEL